MESSDCLMTLDIYLDSGCVTGTFPQHFSINILSGTNEAHIISLPCEASKCFGIFFVSENNLDININCCMWTFFSNSKIRPGNCKEKDKENHSVLLTE